MRTERTISISRKNKYLRIVSTPGRSLRGFSLLVTVICIVYIYPGTLVSTVLYVVLYLYTVICGNGVVFYMRVAMRNHGLVTLTATALASKQPIFCLYTSEDGDQDSGQ